MYSSGKRARHFTTLTIRNNKYWFASCRTRREGEHKQIILHPGSLSLLFHESQQSSSLCACQALHKWHNLQQRAYWVICGSRHGTSAARASGLYPDYCGMLETNTDFTFFDMSQHIRTLITAERVHKQAGCLTWQNQFLRRLQITSNEIGLISQVNRTDTREYF